MEDELGKYYHAQAGNPFVRVYVRKREDGVIEFRLWNREYPEVWEKHGWIDYDTIREAADLYREERDASADPLKIYDLAIARGLLAD